MDITKPVANPRTEAVRSNACASPLSGKQTCTGRLCIGVRAILLFTLSLTAADARAWQWQTTELHYQYGELAAPAFAGGVRSNTRILTVQHASGWGFGDLFLFVDFLNDNHADGFNDDDYYGELYVNFSLGKLHGQPLRMGPVNDVGLIAGVNAAGDAKARKWLPGVRLSWDVPGFAFLNTDFTLYLDDSAGLANAGAPAEDDSYMIDVNGRYPFAIAGHHFSIEGHGEYIGSRTDELGNRVNNWVLLQPQFRYDLGESVFHTPGHLFVGIEWQYWRNKLGDASTEDNVVQALAVVRF